MRLNVISWNIRHLRPNKVMNYLDAILTQVDQGHIMFFYENKDSNEMGREFVDYFEKGLAGSTGTGSQRLKWGGYKYIVGTSEYVWIVYTKEGKTGVKSKFGSGKDFSLEIAAKHHYDKYLYEKGMSALKASSNVTVLSSLSVQQGDFRTPAICHFTLTKPDGNTKVIRIAAWHAPGPAMGSAPLLNYVFQSLLAPEIDLFIGDFNMTGVGDEAKAVLTLHRTNTSTTITGTGPVRHDEGLDLVYRNAATIEIGVRPRFLNSEYAK